MTDIEQQLRTAMHAAVDSAETSPEVLISQVMRRHRRHSLRAIVAAILTALAVAAPVATALEGGFASSGPGHGNQLPSHLPTNMTGLPMPAGTSFQFIVTTAHGAGWYSTATRKIAPITGLPPVLGGYQFKRADGGWLLSPSRNSSPCSYAVCAGRPITWYFVADGSRAATRVGRSYSIAVANQAAAFWLVTYPHVRSGFSVSPSVQLVSAGGRALSPRYRMPAELWLNRAVGSYLLLTDSPLEHWELWDPSTGHVVEHFTDVLAAGPEQIAWYRGCAHCPVLVTNIATGRTVTVGFRQPSVGDGRLSSMPGRRAAAFSDDGQLLAVQQLADGRIVVVNTVSGKVTRIRGSALSSADWQNFYWQAGGHRLIITAGCQQTLSFGQIAYWQPADSRLYLTTIKNAAEVQEIETGAAG